MNKYKFRMVFPVTVYCEVIADDEVSAKDIATEEVNGDVYVDGTVGVDSPLFMDNVEVKSVSIDCICDSIELEDVENDVEYVSDDED